jgi:hypothetical protein
LLAVAAASPDTIKWEGIYRRLKAPGIDAKIYSNPATLAAFLVEFMPSLPLLITVP